MYAFIYRLTQNTYLNMEITRTLESPADTTPVLCKCTTSLLYSDVYKLGFVFTKQSYQPNLIYIAFYLQAFQFYFTLTEQFPYQRYAEKARLSKHCSFSVNTIALSTFSALAYICTP